MSTFTTSYHNRPIPTFRNAVSFAPSQRWTAPILGTQGPALRVRHRRLILLAERRGGSTLLLAVAWLWMWQRANNVWEGASGDTWSKARP
jgi:hypothetical protein